MCVSLSVRNTQHPQTRAAELYPSHPWQCKGGSTQPARSSPEVAAACSQPISPSEQLIVEWDRAAEGAQLSGAVFLCTRTHKERTVHQQHSHTVLMEKGI